MEEISKDRDNRFFRENFIGSFLCDGQWINAGKNVSGKYYVASNGRHRMYIAKKYGLKLIIHVAQEDQPI